MQISAVLEAAAECIKEGFDVHPEIMVPQVCTAQELNRVKSYADAVHTVVEDKYGIDVEFKFGSMMEVVRSCMRAGNLAEELLVVAQRFVELPDEDDVVDPPPVHFWLKFDLNALDLVFEPAGMSARELNEGFSWLMAALYTDEAQQRRKQRFREIVNRR